MIKQELVVGDYVIKPETVGDLSFITLWFGDYCVETKLITNEQMIIDTVDYLTKYAEYLNKKHTMGQEEDVTLSESRLWEIQ